MKIGELLFCLLLLVNILSCQQSPAPSGLRIWYSAPAQKWEESLPLGNGRLGAMPDGGVFKEKITLNDISMWSGGVEDARNREALKYLPKIRKLLAEGKNEEAQEMMYRHFTCGGVGSAEGNGANAPYGCFQVLGNLNIDYFFRDTDSLEYTDYERGLSLNDAVAWTNFKLGKTRYKREYFVSQANDLVVVKLTADRDGKLNFDVGLDRPERFSCYSNDNVVHMEGQLENGFNGKGTRYMAQLKVLLEKDKGSLFADSAVIHVNGATTAYILVSAGTDFQNPDYVQTVTALLKEAETKPYKELKQAHTDKYKEKFDRVELNLGQAKEDLPTDKRLAGFQDQDEPALAALYFQYGRYLMISGTRENSLPLNLQGLWANTVQTPWNGDYHLNINLQMNYWPAEVANLAELHLPLIELTKGLVPSGEVTAQTFYGADGWVAHMMTNPWQFTAPGEKASWGATNTGGAWLCRHLWEHYVFCPDKAYLKEVYPVMKDAARFFLSSMVIEPKNGWLVTSPSSSPENGFYMPGSDRPVYICMGPTMDIEIVRELFTNTVQAAQILGTDEELAGQLQEAIQKLPPFQISPKGGYLQEWLEDYRETDVHHRHVSHLFGLYPANQISMDTPELAEAARKTLERRGDEATGWSKAWKINFWARLHDGNRAYRLLKGLLKPVMVNGEIVYKGGGTYPNLFCAHPPFQIDGNFGGCAGIAEMLLQSQQGYIELLPAIPDGWTEGRFKGLRARGGVIVDAEWKNRKLAKANFRAEADVKLKVKIPDYIMSIRSSREQFDVSSRYIECSLKKGESLGVEFKPVSNYVK
ncbi:MAG: glycoside hydrolase family 95 protein [Odoribacter splanchnicus]|nr:glycoside hydrolase family 95 protein [Odoribacter splanchnicus]